MITKVKITNAQMLFVIILIACSILVPQFANWKEAQVSGGDRNTQVQNVSLTQNNDIPEEIVIEQYAGNFEDTTFVEQATIESLVAPENAYRRTLQLLEAAKESIDLEIQYIAQFGDNWENEENELIHALVDAEERDVDVRVILEGDADSDDAFTYLQEGGVQVVFLNDSQINWNHNKGIVIDNKVTIVSSVNWSLTSTMRNREVGVIINSTSLADYFTKLFNYDFNNGEKTQGNMPQAIPQYLPNELEKYREEYQRGNEREIQLDLDDEFTTKVFDGTFNITGFSNPDSSYDLILSHLASAKESLFVEMYSISSDDIVDQLIATKNTYPSIDMKVIISNHRASFFENLNTMESADRLIEAGINVYESSEEWTFMHAKYWTIDSERTFIYSGNWAGSSVSRDGASPSTTNREWGVVITDEEITQHYEDLFQYDLTRASVYGQPSFNLAAIQQGDVLSGNVSISSVGGDPSMVELYIDGSLHSNLTRSGTAFMTELETTQFADGIHRIELKATTAQGILNSSVSVNIINSYDEWSFLISEVLYDGAQEPDEEFIELANFFNFSIDISNWMISDNSASYTLNEGSVIKSKETFVLARNSTSFVSLWNIDPNEEYTGLNLANSGDYVVLYDPTSIERDAVGWGNAEWDGIVVAQESTGELRSLQRNPSMQDTNDCTIDFIQDLPTPGQIISAESSASQLNIFVTYATVPLLILGVLVIREAAKRNKKIKND